jgi:hypothetical protein
MPHLPTRKAFQAAFPFIAKSINDGGGTADLQLQGGDDCKRDKCAIGAGVEKGVNCGAE